MKTLKKLLIGGGIFLSSLLPMKKSQAQIMDGWFEASKGIKQGNNLRLYPSLTIKDVNLKSLIDLNNFYSFSKTGLSYNKLKVEVGSSVEIKPTLSLFAIPEKTQFLIGPNVSYSKGNSFGFFELGIDPNIKESRLFSYNSLGTPLGNLALFTQTSLKDIKSTYAEIEFTSKDIKDSGVSLYGRTNLMKGMKPTYQAGVSVNPRKLIKKFKRNKK